VHWTGEDAFPIVSVDMDDHKCRTFGGRRTLNEAEEIGMKVALQMALFGRNYCILMMNANCLC
jgi:hypothetical protein